MSSGPGRRPAPATLLAVLLGVAAVVAACGDGVPSLPPTPTPEPFPTPVTSAYTIGLAGTYAGLVVHVDSASATMASSGGTVEITVRIDNPGSDDATLDAPIVLAAGDTAVDPARETVLPDVPPGGSSSLTITFEVGPGFDLAGAAIRVGRTAEHRLVIPLVAGAAPAVTLDPVSVKLAGSGLAGALQVTLNGAELRADLPDWGLEMPLSSLALSITYRVTNRSDFQGGYAFTAANIGLRLPDGKTIGPRTDGHSQTAVVIDAGATVPGLVSRFEVPVPGTGAYALIVRDGTASRAIPFTIATPAAAGP